MKSIARALALALLPGLAPTALATAYNGRPKLIVVIVIDQFRGDYLERYHGRFGEGGFRLFLDRGSVFSDCHYDYANTRTAPGHATLFTGAYSDGHGIAGNEWWDPALRKVVSSVEDNRFRILSSTTSNEAGASPFRLRADTLGDELKLATGNKARVFGISLKDRAAILPAGFSADAAYWIDHNDGSWETSTYYMKTLPAWVMEFDKSGRAQKYLSLEWKGPHDEVLGTTAPARDKSGKPIDFYDLVGVTPFANDYEFEFARELISQEKLGSGEATDLLAISLSANDILGHKVGPDSPQMAAMALALDRQLAGFFGFLGRQIGLANVWIALSADHGIAPLPEVASKLRLGAANLDENKLAQALNESMAAKLPQIKGGPRCLRPQDAAKLHRQNAPDFVTALIWPIAYLCPDTFVAAGIKEADAEQMVGQAFQDAAGLRAFYTGVQLSDARLPDNDYGRQYLHSLAAYGGWYVIGQSSPFVLGYLNGTDHASSYNYDTHVPLAFYGAPFQPGLYRTHSEPVDMVATFSSLLGINRPTHAIGRVLTEALASPQTRSAQTGGGETH